MAKSSTAATPSWGLVLCRVVLGILLVRSGWDWITGEVLDGRDLRNALGGHLGDLPGLLSGWVEGGLLYNPEATALVVRWCTLLAGIGLVLGALTRPAGSFALLVALHLAVYGDPALAPGAWLAVAVALGCVGARAGRRAGLDAMFDSNLPSWATWVRSQPSEFLR